MLIQGVLKTGETMDGDRHGLDGVRRWSKMPIQGVQRIRGTLDGDRRCLDGDRRCSEMLIQGVQKIRGTLDGVRRCSARTRSSPHAFRRARCQRCVSRDPNSWEKSGL